MGRIKHIEAKKPQEEYPIALIPVATSDAQQKKNEKSRSAKPKGPCRQTYGDGSEISLSCLDRMGREVFTGGTYI